jgi:hypothetical protein
MNIGIDIDGTLTRYPLFFRELGLSWRASGHKVYVITGLGHASAVERLSQYADDWYDELIDTSQYNAFERSLIGKVAHNEIIVGHFKQRICREKGVVVMFDDQASKHRICGSTPIFEVK